MFLAALLAAANRQVSPDAILVRRLLQKHVSAFEQLYDRHSRAVYGLILRIRQQAGTAEEVVQEVFLELWRKAEQYDAARGPFLPWLVALARNGAPDTLRLKSERQRRREEQTEELPPVFTALEYEKVLDEKRRAERVRRLISSLNVQQKRAIELAYFEGLSHSEIAEALKEPLGTVKSWMRNGLLRLNDGLQVTV